MALLVTLAAAFLIALAVPISRTRASSEAPAPAPILVAGDGLAAALRDQVEIVAAALAEASLSPSNQDPGYGKLLESVPGAALVPHPLLVAAGKIAARAAFASPETQASLFIQRQWAVRFTLHEQGFASSQRSSGLTVGQALASLGVRTGPHDLISPSPDTGLTSGLHVYVQHASRVDLSVGGKRQTVYTHVATLRELLAEARVKLEPLDRVSPGPATPVRHGMTVQVTAVREKSEYVDEPLAFTTVYPDDPDLLRGDEVLVQAGSNGYIRKEYRVLYENGSEVSREFVAETTVQPVNQIIARGTRVPIYTMPSPQGELGCARTMTVYATWYTASSAGGSGSTATGTAVYKGIVAVDPRVIPLGTSMYIPGYGYSVAADTGGAIIGNMIDLGYGPNDVYDWSTRWVEICILG